MEETAKGWAEGQKPGPESGWEVEEERGEQKREEGGKWGRGGGSGAEAAGTAGTNESAYRAGEAAAAKRGA